MPGPSPSVTTTNNTTSIPQWVSDAGQANYNKAVELDNSPLQQYAGPTVAAPSDATTKAFNYFNAHLGAGSGDTKAASDVFSRLSDLGQVNQGISTLMDPYLDQVVNKSVGAINDQLKQSQMANADAAIKAGAFGGSRQAITDAVSQAEAAKSAGLLSAQLRSQGYNDAANRYLSTQTAAGQGLLSSGDQALSQMLKNFSGLSTIGQQTDQYNQRVTDADVAKFKEARDKELNDLNVRLAALGQTPYNTTSSSSSTSTPGSPGTDYGALALGGLSLLAGFL